LRTLRKKENISLTLNDEFLQYCELNNIEDIEKLANETFNRGFSILKYGATPQGIEIKKIVEEKIKKDPDVVKAVTETVIEIKKSDKNNLYAE
jgi:hypothetical protein